MGNIDSNEYKLLKFVMENSPDIIYIYDIIEKKNIYSNEGISKVLGFTAKEVQEMGEQVIPILMHPDDFENYQHSIWPKYEKAKDNEWIEHNYRIKHKSGEWRWVNSKEKIFNRDNNNVPTQIIGILRDITEETIVKSELSNTLKKVEEGERTFRKLFEDSSDAILLINESGVFIECNQAALDLLKMTKEQFICQSSTKISPEFQPNGRKSGEAAQEMIQLAFKNGLHRFDWTCLNAEGGEFIIEVSLMPISFKGKKVLHTTWREITEGIKQKEELKIAKEKAELNEKKFHSIIDLTPFPVAVVNTSDEKIFFWSQSAKDLFGHTPELVSEWYEKAYPDPEYRQDVIKRWKPFLEEAAETKLPVYTGEYKVTCKNGKVLICELYATFIENYLIVTFNDITLRKISEKEVLLKNQKYESINEELKKTNNELNIAKQKAEDANRLKSEFIKNMSHEIRTPMNGIIGFSDMLDDDGTTQEKRKYYSQIVKNSSHQLLKIIDDILEISTLETKQEKIREEEFCLNDLLMELFSIFSLDSKLRNLPIYVKKALNNGSSFIISDKTKLSKILSNLLGNALKFTSQGYIEIGYLLENNDRLILYVKDTGIGILPENQQKIFERFSQEDVNISEKHGGLGLGLSICKENTELLGGTITLDSKKGEGSTFYVNIPYKASKSGNKLNSTQSNNLKSKNYEILIAEDEDVNYLYIEALIERDFKHSYNLIHARNGEEAVRICLNNSVDLVLMDLKMPIMGGIEATKRIKSALPNLPIIAQTSYSAASDKELALKHGCDDFISKPIETDQLFSLINKYLLVK